MDWNNSRGIALHKPQKKKLDNKLLDYRILLVVRNELKEYIEDIKIEELNNYGKWEII